MEGDFTLYTMIEKLNGVALNACNTLKNLEHRQDTALPVPPNLWIAWATRVLSKISPKPKEPVV